MLYLFQVYALIAGIVIVPVLFLYSVATLSRYALSHSRSRRRYEKLPLLP